MDIHGRINYRANQANYCRCFFDGLFMTNLFAKSISNSGVLLTEPLRRFQRLRNYNIGKVFYN